MNEYIILHRAKDLGTLLEVRTIHEFGTKNTLEGERNFVRFKDITKEDFLCNESPAEIEALIMGYIQPEFDEVADPRQDEPTFSLREINALKDDIKKLKEENAKLKEQLDIAAHDFKYSHFALPSITANEDPIDYLSDKVNRLIYELEKLEKENAKLKEEIEDLNKKFVRERVEISTSYHLEEMSKLQLKLLHSNPANPCCRETYSKLHEALCTVSRNDRLDLINWDQSFIDAIRENKNVQQPKGNKND